MDHPNPADQTTPGHPRNAENGATDPAAVAARPSGAASADARRADAAHLVLGPLEEVTEPLGQLEIGVHGVVVKKGSRSGLLLPQVAPEWGWDVPTLLAQVCLKAGLPEEAWKEGSSPAAIYRFSAEVFGESA